MAPVGDKAYEEVLRRLDEQKRKGVKSMGNEADGQEVDVSIMGNRFSGKNLPVNTMATVATLVILCACATWAFAAFTAHTEETKAGTVALVGALKEQTIAIREQTGAQREQTCLARFAERDRPANADWCKQVSGAGTR